MSPIYVYKIRRRSDGLYSTGGMYPSWKPYGKIWKRKGDLTCHISHRNAWGVNAYKDCDVVEFSINETQSCSVDMYMTIRNEEKEARLQKRELYFADKEEQRRCDRELFDELKRKYGW